MESGAQKTICVMPAYNAERTLEKTLAELPPGCVDEIVLVDDGSADGTVSIARSRGLAVIEHGANRGYGAAQKTGFTEALRRGADLVALVHPDYQYDVTALPLMIEKMRADETALVCLGSRMANADSALRMGMPPARYFANRLLTALANRAFGLNLTEHHTGFRVYRAGFLRDLDHAGMSDDFIFDFQMLAAAAARGGIAEAPARFRYTDESSSISFMKGLSYSIGALGLIISHRFR